jgi:hypothetical protein
MFNQTNDSTIILSDSDMGHSDNDINYGEYKKKKQAQKKTKPSRKRKSAHLTLRRSARLLKKQKTAPVLTNLASASSKSLTKFVPYLSDSKKRIIPEYLSDSKKRIIPEYLSDFNARFAFEKSLAPIIDEAIQNINADKFSLSQKNANWKRGITNRDIILHQPKFDEMIEHIYKVPSITEIFNTNIPDNDKFDIIEQLYILNEMPADTSDYSCLRKDITNRFNRFVNLSGQINIKNTTKIELSLTITSPIPIKYQILASKMSQQNKMVVYKKYLSYEQMNPSNDTRSKLMKLLGTYLSLPTNNLLLKFGGMCASAFLKEASARLNAEVFGMQIAKVEILAALAMRIKNPHGGEIIAFSGPPGVGKTSIIQALGRVTGMPISHVSIGGMRKATNINGSLYVWEGSGPGAIVNSLIQMNCLNGIISLDELDKIPPEHAVDISGALNYVLDFTQNDKFHDNYLTNNFDVDLSNIWFIATLNDPNVLPAPLLNRLKIIKIEGYSVKEKVEMAEKYIIPKMLKNMQLTDQIKFSPGAVKCLTGNDKGVRKMKNKISEVIKKVNLYAILEEKGIKYPIKITEKIIRRFSILEEKECIPYFYL